MRSLLADRRGAALAEMVVVSTPLLVTFFSLAQIAFAYTAKLVVEHGARVSARAAAVLARPNPDAPRDADERIERAAVAAMGPWAATGAITDVRVATRVPAAPFQDVVVELRATYTCSVPVAARLVCGPSGRRPLVARAAFPNQGASYAPFRKRGTSWPR